MLQVNSLSFEYADKPLFQQVQFVLEKGQLLHLRGANGAGKTTLLRLLTGILQPTTGHIYYANQLITDNLAAYQRQLCYVGHKTGLNPLLTVRENCTFDSHWQRKKGDYTSLLKAFFLDEYANKPCHHLSAGQLRRAALLRLAMTDARLWLLDEPFVALDTQSMGIFANLLQQHLNKGGLIILTSHQEIPQELQINQEYLLS